MNSAPNNYQNHSLSQQTQCSDAKELIENLMLEGKLKVSEFVRIVDKGYDTVIMYHTLFGMPTLVHRDVLLLLDSVRNKEIVQIEGENGTLQTLLDNHFLVHENISEREMLDDALSVYKEDAMDGKKIVSLDLLISEACNFGCTHCIYFNSMESGDSVRANKIMSLDQAKHIVDKYTKIMIHNENNILDIHFGAAEPLLNWKTLEDTVLYVKERYASFDCKFSLNTNLALLTYEQAVFLRDNQIDVHVSLDGNKEANDLVRTTKKGRGTFDAIVKKILLLKEIGYPISGISLTITNKNYHLIDKDFLFFCKDMGFGNLAFDIDLLSAISLDGVDIEHVSKKMVEIYTFANELGIESHGTWLTPFNNLIEKSVLKGEIPYFCSAVKGKNLAVSRTGETTTCSYTTTNIGNINNIKFGNDSLLGNLIKNRTPGASQYCSGCEIEGHCAGQCHVTKEIARDTHNDEIISKMCNYYRRTTQLLLENLLDDNELDDNELAKGNENH